MHDVLVDVATSFKQLKVVKIDIDRYPDLATKHRVQVSLAMQPHGITERCQGHKLPEACAESHMSHLQRRLC